MESLFAQYPGLTAALVLVAGLILARLAALGLSSLLQMLDERMARYSVDGRSVLSPGTIRAARRTAFWLLFALAVVTALMVLDVRAVPLAVEGLMGFLARLLAALTILGIGYVLGVIARILVARFGDFSDPNGLIAQGVQWSVLLIAGIMALSQLNIDTTLLTQLLLVFTAVAFGGLALAFALGARDHVANLLGGTELGRFAIGERLRVGSHEGIVLEIRRTSIELETAEGIVSIPAGVVSRETIVRLTQAPGDG